jgi:hypothetical protein
MITARINFRICSAALAALCCLPASAQISIDGRIAWVDRRGPGEGGSAHPARSVLVEVCDNRLPIGTQVVSTTRTDELGHYIVSVPTPAGSQRDILVRARSESPAAAVQAVGTTLTFILPSAVLPAQTSNATLAVDIVGDFTKTNNAAFSVLDALLGARQYVSRVAHTDLASIPVEFPAPGSVSYFQNNQLHILLGDRWDWDVIMHEYGHYVSKSFALDESPGGIHYLDENISDRLPKDSAVRLAWGEGWPTFFSIIAQREMGMAAFGIPYVGDSVYSDTEDASIDIDLASNGDGSLGEDNEVSIMRLLYQSVIHSNDTRVSPADLWQDLVLSKPQYLSMAYNTIIAKLNTESVLTIGTIATEHRIAPGPSLPGAASALADSPPQFSWAANGGGQLHHHNRFTIRFLTRDLKLILESPPIVSGTSFQPTPDQWQTLRNNDVFYWVVAGADNDDPATGPYISATLNLLPIQQAGEIHQ